MNTSEHKPMGCACCHDEDVIKDERCCQEGEKGPCCAPESEEMKGCCQTEVREDCCQVTGGPCRCKGEVAEDNEEQEGMTKEEEYLAGWQRTLADFENYKKRQVQERKEMREHIHGEVIHELLPVVDNFEQAYAGVADDIKEHAWVKGIGFIKQQLDQLLEQQGVQKITAEPGEAFNEERHEAVQETKEKKAATIKDPVIQKVVRSGYTMNDNILRPVRVIVESKS